MRRAVLLLVLAMLVPLDSSSQDAVPSVALDQGRPKTAGITRTTLKDDAKSTVTRVQFAPGAAEPPHRHPYDVILVPVTNGPVDFGIAGQPSLTSLKAGAVQFVSRDTTHHLTNTGKQPLEVIAIAVK